MELHPIDENLQDYRRKTNKVKQICKSSKQKSWHKYIEEITHDTNSSSMEEI